MRPILFSLHFLSAQIEINSYSFFLALATLFAFLGGIRIAKKQNISLRNMSLILLGTAVSAFIGARIFHGMINFKFYLAHPQRWLAFDNQGFAIFGGILSAAIFGILICKILKLDYWKIGDQLAPFLGISIAIVRIGCFLNGCCFGKETNLPWGVTFPLFSQAHKYQLSQNPTNLFSSAPVHPTQLYELIAAIIGSFLAIYILKKKLPSGTAILSFGIWFSLFRLGNQFLRVPAQTFNMPGYFYPVFYLGMILILSIKLFYNKKAHRFDSSNW